jgi:hypothetical protein
MAVLTAGLGSWQFMPLYRLIGILLSKSPFPSIEECKLQDLYPSAFQYCYPNTGEESQQKSEHFKGYTHPIRGSVAEYLNGSLQHCEALRAHLRYVVDTNSIIQVTVIEHPSACHQKCPSMASLQHILYIIEKHYAAKRLNPHGLNQA